jgi:hypothetical protein
MKASHVPQGVRLASPQGPEPGSNLEPGVAGGGLNALIK